MIVFALLAMGTLTGLSCFLNSYSIYVCCGLALLLILRVKNHFRSVILVSIGIVMGCVVMFVDLPDTTVEYTGRVTGLTSGDRFYVSNGFVLLGEEWEPFEKEVLIDCRSTYREIKIETGGLVWCSGKLQKIGTYPFITLNGTIISSVIPETSFTIGYSVKESVLTTLEEAGVNTAILSSVLFGDKRKLDSDFKKAINRAGVAHLFAVSGLHVGIFYAFTGLLGGLFVLPRNSRIAFSLFVTGLYCLSTGPSISCLRAYIVFAAYGLFSLLDYPQSPLNILGLTGILMLLINPISIASAGFQLSFFSTAGILLLVSTMETGKRNNIVVKTLLVGIAAQGAILPISLSYFGNIAILAVPLTLIVVPVFLLPMIGAGFLCYIFGILKLKPLTSILAKGLNFLSKILKNSISAISELGPEISFEPSVSYLLALVVAVSVFLILFWQSGHRP